jgi:hypothetical protein
MTLYNKKTIIQRNNKFHTTTVLHRYNHICARVRRRTGPLNSLSHNHTCNASTKIWTSFTHIIQNSHYLWHRKCIKRKCEHNYRNSVSQQKYSHTSFRLHCNKSKNIACTRYVHLRSLMPFCNVHCKADFENMAKYSGMMIKRQDYVNLQWTVFKCSNIRILHPGLHICTPTKSEMHYSTQNCIYYICQKIKWIWKLLKKNSKRQQSILCQFKTNKIKTPKEKH